MTCGLNSENFTQSLPHTHAQHTAGGSHSERWSSREQHTDTGVGSYHHKLSWHLHRCLCQTKLATLWLLLQAALKLWVNFGFFSLSGMSCRQGMVSWSEARVSRCLRLRRGVAPPVAAAPQHSKCGNTKYMSSNPRKIRWTTAQTLTNKKLFTVSYVKYIGSQSSGSFRTDQRA